MEFGQLLEWIATYGLGNVISIFVIFYVFNENSKREKRLMDDSLRREEVLTAIVTKHLALIDEHVQQLSKQMFEHDNQTKYAIQQMNEFNKLQRIEHEKMVQALNIIINSREGG